MKSMRKIYLLLLLAGVITWSGCSDDKNDPAPNRRDDASLLAGTWQTTTHKWVAYENGKRVGASTDKDDWFTLTLDAAGNFNWDDDYVNDIDGRYTYDTGNYTFRMNVRVDFGLETATVDYLSEKKLVLHWIEEYTEEGVTEKLDNTLSFRRIQ